MVQFGRRLVEERYPEWREFYIRYKELKNALYAEREDIEGGEKSGLFVKTLQAEIMKANDFYVKTETRLRGQLDILEEEIKHEKNRRRAVQVGEEANRETLRAGVERIEIVCYFELHRGGESGEEV